MSASSRRGATASTRPRSRSSNGMAGDRRGGRFPTGPNWSPTISNPWRRRPNSPPSSKPTPASPRSRGRALKGRHPRARHAPLRPVGHSDADFAAIWRARSSMRRGPGRRRSLGASGLPAAGERGTAPSGSPTAFPIFSDAIAMLRGRTTLVVGSGHSAANALLELAELAETEPRTSILWATRGTDLARIFSGGDADQLPARGELGANVRALVDSGRRSLRTGFAVLALARERRIVVKVDGRRPALDRPGRSHHRRNGTASGRR